MPLSISEHFSRDIHPRLPRSPRIRLPLDTIPDRHTLVYKYLSDDLLSLVKQQVSERALKQILKASLQGIAELHDCDMVHLGT